MKKETSKPKEENPAKEIKQTNETSNHHLMCPVCNNMIQYRSGCRCIRCGHIGDG